MTQNGKENRSRSPVQRDNSAERKHGRKTWKIHLEKKIVLRVSTAKEEIVVMIESANIGILRIANSSRKIDVKWERIVTSSTHIKRNSLPALNEKEKVKEEIPKKKS